MDFDFTSAQLISSFHKKKTIVSMDFNLGEKEIDFILNYNLGNDDGKKPKDRIYVNGRHYTIYGVPTKINLPIRPQVVKLELELCVD